MATRGLFVRALAGATGAALLTGVAGAALAEPVDGDDVRVDVEIDAVEPAGALTMSVAADSTTLAEVASGDPAVRQFDGALPTVTVTDDRGEVPAGQFWYVTGQSSAFEGEGLTSLPAGHLGWRPNLITEGDGEVAAGEEVVTVLDDPTTGSGATANNVGLVGEELLALALDSTEASAQGTWQADADLFLKTPADVAPGSYSATLTLTLWEDEY
ncbi:hypothetical protein [Aquipuribacter hungaricus]|uniref:WxL domain-containing protein n=1 Tax=Aquipuribacter hungaricus TaxID=545624 RepID=A0ABV7WHL0_9MICO